MQRNGVRLSVPANPAAAAGSLLLAWRLRAGDIESIINVCKGTTVYSKFFASLNTSRWLFESEITVFIR